MFYNLLCYFKFLYRVVASDELRNYHHGFVVKFLNRNSNIQKLGVTAWGRMSLTHTQIQQFDIMGC